MSEFSLHSPGFLNLLASQSGESSAPVCSNQQRIHPVEDDSSEQPAYSTQCSDESTARERRQWTPKEDLILIGAWLNTSKDPVISNEQKGIAFWMRIVMFYNSNPQLLGSQPRELGQIKQRWHRINAQVCKFVGCYDAALREQSSGQNDDDVMKSALDKFFSDNKIKFTLEHAWRELKHDQKWCATNLAKDGGKEKRKESVHVDTEEEVDKNARPPGVKAAKYAKRKKNPEEEARAHMQSLLEMKDKLNKQKLLEVLLSKPEPLSEIEIALKLKLMTEML